MQKLKVMIKETVEERRKLTEDEAFIHEWGWGGLDYLVNNKGFDPLSKIADETYSFKKEKIREATEEEKNAWWLLQRADDVKEAAISYAIDIKGDIYLDGMTVSKATKFLKDKEIILEILEE